MQNLRKSEKEFFSKDGRVVTKTGLKPQSVKITQVAIDLPTIQPCTAGLGVVAAMCSVTSFHLLTGTKTSTMKI